MKTENFWQSTKPLKYWTAAFIVFNIAYFWGDLSPYLKIGREKFGSYSPDGQLNNVNFILHKCVIILRPGQVPNSNTCDLKMIMSQDGASTPIISYYGDSKVRIYITVYTGSTSISKIRYAINSIGNVQVFESNAEGCNWINEYSQRNNKYYMKYIPQIGCPEVQYYFHKMNEKKPDKGYSEVFVREYKGSVY